MALLEANPRAATRLAGEWLHPLAVRMLRDAGIRLDPPLRSTEGQGFVVFPEDGSEPIVLPYPFRRIEIVWGQYLRHRQREHSPPVPMREQSSPPEPSIWLR